MARGPAMIVVLVTLALVSGCGLAAGGDGRDLAGQVVVLDGAIRAAGGPCAGARPFLYVHPGAAVVVRDGDGEVLAEGEVGDGEAVNAHEPLEDLARAPTFCRMEFEVRGVPEADVYEVQFGDGHTATFTHSELEEADWYVLVTVP